MASDTKTFADTCVGITSYLPMPEKTLRYEKQWRAHGDVKTIPRKPKMDLRALFKETLLNQGWIFDTTERSAM
jgi:hypothetical protein